MEVHVCERGKRNAKGVHEAFLSKMVYIVHNGEGSEYLRAWPPHIKLCLVNPSPRDVSEMKLHAHGKYRILRLMHEFEKPRKGKI